MGMKIAGGFNPNPASNADVLRKKLLPTLVGVVGVSL